MVTAGLAFLIYLLSSPPSMWWRWPRQNGRTWSRWPGPCSLTEVARRSCCAASWRRRSLHPGADSRGL